MTVTGVEKVREARVANQLLPCQARFASLRPDPDRQLMSQILDIRPSVADLDVRPAAT